MAPVTVKRKSMRFLAPMPKELQAISQEILKKSQDPSEHLSALQKLSGTVWTFEKGDLFQWIAVLDSLDAELAKPDSTIEILLESLRCCRALLENCSNRHVFNSYEHLQRLLESENPDVVMAVLRVLSVLSVPRSTRQIVADAKFTPKLVTLATSWGAFGGTGDHALSIVSCCLDSVDQVMKTGTTVHMETYKLADASSSGEKEDDVGLQADEGVAVVHIDQAHLMQGSDSEVFEEVLRRHSVPKSSHFDLKTRLRLARAFSDAATRRQWARIQILALTVLAQCQSAIAPAPSMFTINEGCIVELIELLQHPDVPLDIQTMALKSLTALLSERSRQFSPLITANSTSHHGVLPSLIRKFKNLVANPPADGKEHLRFGEGLLGLTWTFAGSNTGSVALHNAGMVHMLVPMFRLVNASMVKFLTLAVKTLEVLMNYSQDMQQCFRELNGVSELVDLAYDVVCSLSPADDTPSLSVEGQQSLARALTCDTEEARFENCRLLSAILHLLSSAAAPVATTTDVRELAAGTKLPHLLKAIFKGQHVFGAGVFEKAAALLTEFVHQEPGSLQQFITGGVAESFLNAITGDFPPSRGVVNAIPSALGALCLSAAGTQLVEAAKPLEHLLKSLGSEKVVFFLHGDCPSNLGVQLEELMRHNPSLLDSSMGGCVALVSQIPVVMSTLDPAKSDMEITKHMYLITAVEFVGKLLEPLMSVAEHARSFIRRGGVKALLDILSLPDLPKNFSRTEAGKYLVLVVGRAASQSVPEVLGDLIQRTNGYLKSVTERCALSNLVDSSVSSQILEGDGEKHLLDLEMHSSLLAGVMASFSNSRGFSPIQEWNTSHGSELLQLASRCFVALRIAASCSAKAGSGAATGEGAPPSESAEAMQIAPAPASQAGQEAVADRPENDATANKTEDEFAQTHVALSTLFSRLSAALSTPSRRRPDDRSPQQVNEKAVSAVLGKALNHLLEGGENMNTSPAASLYFKEVLELFTICIFGNEEMLRSRPALNMLILHELVNDGFISKLGRFTSRLVNRIIEIQTGDSDSAALDVSMNVFDTSHTEIFQALAGCLSFVLKLLPSASSGAQLYSSFDRNGALVPHPGFDGVLFASTMKVEIYDAIDPLWPHLPKFSASYCPPALVSALFEFLMQHLRPDVATSQSPRAVSNAPVERHYDPQTVASLMEMGFDERRVHAALDAIRSNSVELATEWLFMHSFGTGAEDEESEIARAMALSLQQDAGSASSEPAMSDTSNVPTIEKRREAQTEKSQRILVDRCLEVASSNLATSAPSAIPFAIADVLTFLCQKEEDRNSIICKMLEKIKRDGAIDIAQEAQSSLSALLHVGSILFNDNAECCKTAVGVGFLTTVCDLVRQEAARLSASVANNVSIWVCPCLLVLCTLLKYLDDSRKMEAVDLGDIAANKEDSAMKGSPSGGSSFELKEIFLDKDGSDMIMTQGEMLVEASITFLRRSRSPLVNQATLQLLTRITRVHKNAALLLHSGGIQVMLASPAESAFTGQALLVGSILRHVLEDVVTLQTTMQAEIRVILSSLTARNNNRPLSLRAFLSAAATLAQRDPLVFCKAVCACCQISESEGRRLIHLSDKKEEKSAPSGSNDRCETGVAPEVNESSKGQTPGKCKNAAKAPELSHQLINILVEHMFSLINKKPAQSGNFGIGGSVNVSSGVSAMELDVTDSAKETKNASDEKQSTALTLSNVLRFLTELVKYFVGCSHALIKCNVPCKWRGDGAKRSSDGVVAFILCELLSGDTEIKGSEAALCSQRASQLIVALFCRGSEIRKKIVGEIVRAIQQPASSASKGMKTSYMQRLQAIGDLLAMLLSPSKSSQMAGHISSDTAKIFLDSSLPATISAAMSSMDLQHPMASKVANALLRPLDLLCTAPVSSRHRADATEQGHPSEHPPANSVEGDGVRSEARRGEGREHMADSTESRSDRAMPDTAENTGSSMVVEQIQPSAIAPETEGSSSQATASATRRQDSSADAHDNHDHGHAAQTQQPASSEGVRPMEHVPRSSQGDLNRLMAVLRHMERGNSGLDEEESEGSDGQGGGEDEDEDHEDDDDEGSDEEEESTLDVEEESEEDEEEDDEEDNMAQEGEHVADFLTDDLFGNEGQAHDDGPIAWPRGHEVVINSEQELDHLMQRVMQHPQVRMARNWGEDGDNAEQELDGDGQVLGFWVPGGGNRATAHPGAGGLHDVFPDMHVIQFPGRVARGLGGNGSAGSVRVAVQEGSAGAHPLLSRLQSSGRSTRVVSYRSRGVGEDYRAMFPPTQAPSFFFSQLGGRFIYNDPSGGGVGREDGADGGWSRWTDDGSGSSGTMRNLALALEPSLQTVLVAANRPVPSEAQPSSSEAQAASSESQVAAGVADNSQELAAHDDANSSTSPTTAPAAAAPTTAAAPEASALVELEMADASDSHRNTQSDVTRASVQDSGSVSATTAPGPMVEDDDELALALRLSMEAEGSSDAGGVEAVGEQTSHGQSESAASASTQVEQAVTESSTTPGVAGTSASASTNESQADAQQASTESGTAGNLQSESAIDAAFLAELPEELRAEVIAQQAAQNGSSWSQGATSQSGADGGAALEDGGIDPEFLAALPPDIQADVLRQHQRAQASAAAEPANVSLAGEMDNGSFIATLSAELREEVLLTADEAFLASLPPHLAAEAALLRERAYHAAAVRAAPLLPQSLGGVGTSRRNFVANVGGSRAAGQERSGAGTEVAAETRQVMPGGSEKSIVRLLELSSGVNKNLLHSVLLHLCAHAVTRSPTVRLLLVQALAPVFAEMEAAHCISASAAGLAKRALEALCHVTAQQPLVAPLLLDRALLVDMDAPQAPSQTYTGKGKNRADRGGSRSDHGASVTVSSSDKGTALDKMLTRLAAPDVLKSAAMLDLLAQLILATLVPSKNSSAAKNAEGSSKMPVLGETAFRSLALALGVLGAGRQTGERLMGALQALCGRQENRKVCIPLLLEHIRQAASECRQNLASLGYLEAEGKGAAAPEPLDTSHADLRLLRLAKSLRSICSSASAAASSKQGGEAADESRQQQEGGAGSSKEETVVMDKEEAGGEAMNKEGEEAAAPLWKMVAQDALWSALSTSLSAIDSQQAAAASKPPTALSSISPALSRLQPLVEAYFVIHAPPPGTTQAAAAPHHSTMGQAAPAVGSHSLAGAQSGAAGGTRLSPRGGSGGMSPRGSGGGGMSPRGSGGGADGALSSRSRGGQAEGGEAWVDFAERHRNALNAYLRQDKSLLQPTSTFGALVTMPRLLDFDNKKAYFRAELKRRNSNHRHGTLRISVRRDFVLEDSFHQMALRRPDELKGRLHVTFQGEEGVDAGGLSREWFLTLSKQMLNPDKALFLPSVNGLTFQPNPASGIQPDHLAYFKFAGQAVAKALWDEQLLDAHFTLSLYKHLLNQPIEIKDVESIDPEYYPWMLDNDITNILEETFSIVRQQFYEEWGWWQFGEMLIIDLKPNGRNLPVTEANKHEYVQLVAEHVMTKGIRDQVEALKQGFHELIPADLILIFSPQELELLLCGLPTIDVEDLRGNTEYTGYTRDSPQIQWFWTVVQVPMEGFQALRGMNGPQRFNIHRCGDSRRLPSSHTCFNQLDLPEYPSHDVLQRCLLSAIREGFEGFGFS